MYAADVLRNDTDEDHGHAVGEIDVEADFDRQLTPSTARQ